MFLYRYEMHFPTIHVEKVEVTERPKTYITSTHSRILKSEIGIVSKSWRTTLYLYEKDFEKVKATFLEYMKHQAEQQQREIEMKQKNLADFQKNIEQFSQLDEKDVIYKEM